MCVLIVSIPNVLDWLLDFHLKAMQMYFLVFLDVVGYQGKSKHHSNVKIFKLIPRIFFFSLFFLASESLYHFGTAKGKDLFILIWQTSTK